MPLIFSDRWLRPHDVQSETLPSFEITLFICGVCTALKGWLKAKIQHFCSKKAQSMQLLKEICGKKTVPHGGFLKWGYPGLFGATPILGNQRTLGEARHVVNVPWKMASPRYPACS